MDQVFVLEAFPSATQIGFGWWALDRGSVAAAVQPEVELDPAARRGDHAAGGPLATHGIDLVVSAGNVEEHTFHRPTGLAYGVALRAYDAEKDLWSIWWLDSRYPTGPVGPPAQGHFEHGVGTFYSDYEDKGKPMRDRLVWSEITPTSARWEQASSTDGGKTWESNWIMTFKRRS